MEFSYFIVLFPHYCKTQIIGLSSIILIVENMQFDYGKSFYFDLIVILLHILVIVRSVIKILLVNLVNVMLTQINVLVDTL